MSAPTSTSRVKVFQPKIAQTMMEDRIGMALVIIAAALAVFMAVLTPVLALNWRSEPFFGALFTRTLVIDGSRPASGVNWAGLEAGLQRSDRILAINGQSVDSATNDIQAALDQFKSMVASLNEGDSIEVTFERPLVDGQVGIKNQETCQAFDERFARCVVRYTLEPFQANDFLALFVIPYVSGLVTLGTGLLVLVLRFNQPTARIASAVCIGLAGFMLGLFDINSTHTLSPLWLVATINTAGVATALTFVFPTKKPIIYRQPAVRLLPLAITAVITLIFLYLYYNPTDPRDASPTMFTSVIIGFVGLIIVIIDLLQRRGLASSAVVRDQINAVLIGTVLSLLIGLVWIINLIMLNLTGRDVIPLTTSAATPFLILPALSLAYAVLQYRLVDTDRVISQALTYLVMAFGLIVGYSMLVFSVTLVAKEVSADNPILIAVVIFFIAVLFLPVRLAIQQRIDRLYFRERVNYQNRVETFAQKLSTLGDFSQIMRLFRDELEATLAPQRLFIFMPDRQTSDYVAFAESGVRPPTDVRFSGGSPLIRLLSSEEDALIYLEPGVPWPGEAVAERARLMILKTLAIVGLRGSARLNGFICISAPRSGRGRYSYEELRFIQNLTGQIVVAVERAQVVESLERRVRQLDVLGQVSQAANFAVDFDDLLELITTQTTKLIDATHVYIALRDPIMNELYFAFFLEDGDRLPEKENRRWPLGRDLFSEIVRSGQPLRVERYWQTLKERGAAPLYEDPDLKAWMGVPLITGTRTLGVMAVGMTTYGKLYSEEQLKTFNDIGSLAATSLEKARLFAETNMRARQLAALNDISRQLVAVEFDVEKLLQLITASATDILGAEAGSLLLTVDDSTGDLEFRVAIGGSGGSLVGSRLPVGRGLVGHVAKTGEVVIVNDVINDPRWGGELGKGGFQTSNVLAVPLLTQDRVIGVLEVLNKKSSANFTQEDANLLTTFAGQAAVAIENARLFQLTDLQLTERLTELETLERIDVELNRSLDLGKVAEITVRWAMANSGATAGALGVVVGDPPRLDVVYRVGYEADDLPAGVDGVLWPLDRGIVSRVMRTRQPDLVPDVSIDRDYVPSLRGSLSQITLPMLSGRTINALLILEKHVEPRLRLADMPFLQRLAEHASIAIANAQLYAELTRANQSKSEFVSFVAHELKNPLTSIKGYSDVLLTGAVGPLSDQQKSFLGTIRFNADRMNTLVSDLNDVTKLQTNNLRIELSPIQFRTVVTETLRPLQKQIEDRQQELVLDIPEDLPLINGDQNRLIQVMTNLVSNAHKYSGKGGRITISAQINPNFRDAKGRAHGRMLHIRVSDTGIGMSAEDLARLFTPYFRSDNPQAREQPGTGLGLTITRGIVERHNGTIWVESELNVGTTFHFTLPLSSETAAEKIAK